MQRLAWRAAGADKWHRSFFTRWHCSSVGKPPLQCDIFSVHRQPHLLWQPLVLRRVHTSPVRHSSSSGVYEYLHHQFRIEDVSTARELVDHFLPQERELLLKLLNEKAVEDQLHKGDEAYSTAKPTAPQIKQLFIVNTIPFIGFGLLDNMIMILAGEYIDQSLGVILGISTMAAAALGNIISDVAGVGLAHYVEKAVSRLGFKHPVLTGEQLESKSARFVINFARAFGLVFGCLIGMFPLLFFKESTPAHEKVPTPRLS